MTNEEILEQMHFASLQFDLRAKRLKEFYLLNGGAPSDAKAWFENNIKKEYELLRDAGERISFYSQPYESIVSKIPEVQGERLIKDAFDAEVEDEMKTMHEEDIKSTKELLLQNNPDFSPVMLDKIFEAIKDKIVIL
jgi:hypothetical protein